MDKRFLCPDGDIPKLNCADGYKVSNFTKNDLITHLKQVNFMIYKLYLNEGYF